MNNTSTLKNNTTIMNDSADNEASLVQKSALNTALEQYLAKEKIVDNCKGYYYLYRMLFLYISTPAERGRSLTYFCQKLGEEESCSMTNVRYHLMVLMEKSNVERAAAGLPEYSLRDFVFRTRSYFASYNVSQ